MEFEVVYTLENEEQFWEELDDIVSVDCPSHGLIDNALRSYLAFTGEYKAEYLPTDYDLARCSYKLLSSSLFAANKEYVRKQIICSLLQEDSTDTLHLIIAFLLFDGRQDESSFEMMNQEGVFPRLLDMIQEKRDGDVSMHKMLLELLYEMSRIQRVRLEELLLINDEFIIRLFDAIECISDDVNDPYHYPIIRVLLILNEQYMVLAHNPEPEQLPTTQVTNKVIKTLSVHGPGYKTFGQNIILLLNRESETSLQLLILKLLYLLFTTPSTYEYFYTNDLRVLVDVIIRNLLDLPLSASALRHTYLRVLYPLLAHTQLKYPPHYKRDELRRLLAVMTSTGSATSHFGGVDETTKRLVGRCLAVDWLLQDNAPADPAQGPTPATASKLLGVGAGVTKAMTSAVSVAEVAAQREKPGVQTPSVGNEARHGNSSSSGSNGSTD